MARTTPVNSGYTIINGSTTGTNGSKVNTWLEYKVLSQSIVNNTSTVRVILYSQATISSSTHQTGTARQYGYVQAGDSSSTKYYLSTTFTYEDYHLNKFADHTFTITHETNGTKSIRLAGAFDISAYVGKYITGGSASATVTLPTIPQYATVTQTVQSKTETSITMTWTSDSVIDYVKYSIDNGATWVNVGAVNSTTGSYTISGLAIGTTYPIKTQVRNKSSQLTTDSSASNIATYNYPFASATPDFTLGGAVKITFYNPLGRTFSFRIVVNGQEITDPSWTTNGTSWTGFNDSTTISSLYAKIPSAKSGTYYIRTAINGYTLTSVVSGTFSANASVCKPSITALQYADTNTTVTAITQNDQNIVQNRSTVRYTATGVTGNYSATISSVKVEVNNQTYTLSKSGSNYIGGDATIDSGQNVTAVCTITDSRGYTATASVTVTMLGWVLPSAIIMLNRQNNYYSETDVTVDATYSSIDGKNTISISYQARIQGTETWTVTGTLQDNVQSTFVADNQYAWEVQIILVDAFGGTTTYNAVIQRGMPLIFFDRLKTSVGINCFPASNDTLYVNNRDIDKGFRTYRATYLPSGADLNDYVKAGTFSCTSNAIGRTLVNSPEQTGFIMFVFNAIGNTPTDLNDGGVSRYFIQMITSWQGRRWIREVHINSSGNKTVGAWQRIIDTSTFVKSAVTVPQRSWQMSATYKAQIFDALEYVKNYKNKHYNALCVCQFNDVHGFVNTTDTSYVGFKGQEPSFLAYHGTDIIDKIIFNGDIATQAKPAEYDGAMEFMLGASTLDTLYAMGNHEYGYYNDFNVENPELFFKTAINVDVTYSGLKKSSDDPEALIYYHDDGGIRYIVLNYYYINQTVDTTAMLFDTNQQNWLCSVLASAGSKDIVLIGHTLINPIVRLSNGGATGTTDYLTNQDKLIDIINAFRNRGTYGSYNFSSCTGKFIMYTSGHYHGAGKTTGVDFNAFVGASLNRNATANVNGFFFYLIDRDKQTIQILLCSRETDNYQSFVYSY